MNSVRIIGGKWRSRKIHFGDNSALRPSPDRVRETIFNWLATDLIEANCLDLFSGSGVLGFETLSRGAASVTFVERDLATFRQLKKAAQELGAESAAIFYLEDALKWLAHKPMQQFNIVFLDPPFNQGLLEKSLQLLQENDWLAKDALIYVEMERNLDLILPNGWEWLRQKSTQQIEYGLIAV